MRSSPIFSIVIPQDEAQTARKVGRDNNVERPITSSHSMTTDFHITGFHRFFNVPINPTELIVRALPDYILENSLASNANIVSTTVLKVAAQTTRQKINDMYARHTKAVEMRLQSRRRSPTSRTIFIHMGVNMSANKFYLELQARNEATFLCADELGWTPIRETIDPDDSDITTTHRTTIDVHSLCKQLTSLGHPVGISRDAGRFVCNWVYFNSLKNSQRANTHALFIHVPPTFIVPIERQVQFIASTLDCIAQLP